MSDLPSKLRIGRDVSVNMKRIEVARQQPKGC